jgi:uncharacterized membrane protein affecting hemolysin expression
MFYNHRYRERKIFIVGTFGCERLKTDLFVCRTPNNLEVKVSRKASNKGEKSENGDEKKLETVRVKSKDKRISLKIVTDGGNISLALSRSSQESRDGATLLTLKNGKSILVKVFLVSGESGLTGLCCLSVEFRVTLDLKTRISEVRNLVRSRRSLVFRSSVTLNSTLRQQRPVNPLSPETRNTFTRMDLPFLSVSSVAPSLDS